MLVLLECEIAFIFFSFLIQIALFRYDGLNEAEAHCWRDNCAFDSSSRFFPPNWIRVDGCLENLALDQLSVELQVRAWGETLIMVFWSLQLYKLYWTKQTFKRGFDIWCSELWRFMSLVKWRSRRSDYTSVLVLLKLLQNDFTIWTNI